ncbi:MAG: DUF1905 domain-containing protein [Erysipelotrichaceae bacterium]
MNKFSAEIKKIPDKEASYIEVPFDVEAIYGKKRVKVHALLDQVSYRGSIVKMGLPCYMLGIPKIIREQLQKTYGDRIEVVIEEDLEVRSVEVPEEIKVCLNKDELAYVNDLSFTSQKKLFQPWLSAKTTTTKQKHQELIVQAIQMREVKK